MFQMQICSYIKKRMEKGRERRSRRSSNSSSIDSNHLPLSSSASTSWLAGPRKNLGSDLSLNLNLGGFSPSYEEDDSTHRQMEVDGCGEEGDESDNNATFYVKVYMEGIPIGRKLDLLAHDGYHELITTLDSMFSTSILWSEMDEAQREGCHVLTYEDKEGDWLMVGDVPWEIFLSSVRRLKITRIC